MKKRLIIIGVSALIFTVGTLLIILTSGVSDDYSIDQYLTDNGYKLIDDDTAEYIKETGSIDTFYGYLEDNKDASYLAYYFSIQLKTFKEYKMNYNSSNKNTLVYTLTNRLDTNVIEFQYEISNDDDIYSVEGTYDIDDDKFECKLVNNNLVNKTTYCNNAKNKVDAFIPKRDRLLENEYIIKAINTKQNEVKAKGS